MVIAMQPRALLVCLIHIKAFFFFMPHAASIYTMSLERTVKTNEGSIDRVIRVVIGLALLSLVVVGPKSLLGLIGLIPLLTGLFGFCPLYKLLGLNTCPMGK